ncbi:MAG TPA: SRPBCC family protein [Gaiellaceae bacterium]
MRIGATTGIARPPEEVFDLVADMRNETRWNSTFTSGELRSGEPIELGSRFAIVNSGTPYDVTITTYDRPSRLVFEASGNPDLTIAYTFTATGDGTNVDSAFDFRPKGVWKVVFPLLAPVIRRNVRKQYASLKALCER